MWSQIQILCLHLFFHISAEAPIQQGLKTCNHVIVSSNNSNPSSLLYCRECVMPCSCQMWTGIPSLFLNHGSRGSSGSIVSDYGLDYGAIEVRSPAQAADFSDLCVQTGSGAHPGSCLVGTEGPFPGGKARPGRDADESPYLMPKLKMCRSYTFCLPSASRACSRTAITEPYHITIVSRVAQSA
jgi:hypothetical protein